MAHTTVKRWWIRWRNDGNVKRKKGTGRKRSTSEVTDRKLVISSKRNRFTSVPRLFVSWKAASGIVCSLRTAYRRLEEAGLKSYRPAVRIPLSKFMIRNSNSGNNHHFHLSFTGHEHMRKRVEWCEEHLSWSQEEWREVLWTNESRFTLDFHDGRVRVHRMPGERYAPCCISEHDRFGGGSIMIWAGIWYGGRTVAIIIRGNLNGEQYLSEILSPVVIPTVNEHGLIFQDDNARPH